MGDKAKTAMVTPYLSYGILVILFSLTNFIETSCNLINNVFHEFLDNFVVYFYDIMVYNNSTFVQHLVHLQPVF